MKTKYHSIFNTRVDCEKRKVAISSMAELGCSSEADDGKHHKQNKSNGSKRNVNQHLRVTSKGTFKWHGIFEELQVFVNEELEIQTKWRIEIA